MKNYVLFLTTCITAVVLSVIDSSFAVLFATFLIIGVGMLFCIGVQQPNRGGAFKTLFFVATIYMISAYIFSLSFDQNNSFAVSDSMRYLQYYQDSRSYFRGLDYLMETYMGFADNNGLYNSYIQFWAALGNNDLDGASVFYMTLAQTLFGVLCSIALFRIISRYFPKNAVRYTVSFSCCSLFLFYSSVIIRDITIALFFIYALDYLKQDFKYYRLFLLIVFSIIVMGIRLYTGLFYLVFSFCYVALDLTKNAGKKSTIVLLVLTGLLLLPIVVTSTLGEQTQVELELYDEFGTSRNESGLYAKLSKLPPGAKQIALTLFSQISPFPPQSLLFEASTFSQVYMGLDYIVFEIFWFFIFFVLAYLCIIRGKYKLFEKNELVLLLIALLFIVVNTSHIDIRRMLPVYPCIYFLYLSIKSQTSHEEFSNVKSKLKFLYFALFLFALFYRSL